MAATEYMLFDKTLEQPSLIIALDLFIVMTTVTYRSCHFKYSIIVAARHDGSSITGTAILLGFSSITVFTDAVTMSKKIPVSDSSAADRKGNSSVQHWCAGRNLQMQKVILHSTILYVCGDIVT